MTAPMNILFLCSGGGGNLRFIHHLLLLGALPGITSISVIADRPCQAVDWAKAHGLQANIIPVSRGNQADLLAACKSHPSSIVITNIHKVLDAEVVNAYRRRIINLHYSLLPAFAGTIGMRSLASALSYGSKIVGATAHHVTDELDAGPPIAQVAFACNDSQLNDKVVNLMFRAGCIALFSAVSRVNGKPLDLAQMSIFSIKDSTFWLSPPCALPAYLSEEYFWESLN